MTGNPKGNAQAIGLAALMLGALACTCGPWQQAQNAAATARAVQATAQALATVGGESFATLQAAATEAGSLMQTVQAGVTYAGPELDATLTAVVATADALGGSPPTLVESVGNAGTYDGGDGLGTADVQAIDPGQTANARLDNTLLAHNWVLVATAGQTLVIRVEARDSTDPVLKVIGPDGTLLATDDDSGGGLSAEVTITMPVTGLYTLRVTVNVGGAYTISVMPG